MSKFTSIRLPFHRLHLLEFWGPKADPGVARGELIDSKVLLRKLWKQKDLEPAETVLPT